MRNPSHQRQKTADRLAKELGFDDTEFAVLTIMRHIFQSFADPESQSWMRAFYAALQHFPEEKATHVMVNTLSTLQAMRHTRASGFSYSNPSCARCSAILREDECRLLSVLAAFRRGMTSQAHGYALILCEGNDSTEFLRAAKHLAECLNETVATIS